MQSASEYINKTESALRKLFEGIDSYIEILRKEPTTCFISSSEDEAVRDTQRKMWLENNKEVIAASLQAQRNFVAESFAQATLCGAVLQVAAKALEIYSMNNVIPLQWQGVIKPGSKAVPFCVGRSVRGIPLGLVIYSARNQHTHFEDEALREPNNSIFEQLAINHGYSSETPFRDPAFDLNNPLIRSFSSNVMALLEWRTYDDYEKDMNVLLAI